MKPVKHLQSPDDQFSQNALAEASQEVAEEQQRRTFNKWLLKRAQKGFTPAESQAFHNFYHALTSIVHILFEGKSSKASGEVVGSTSLLVTLFEGLATQLPYGGTAVGKGGAWVAQQISIEQIKRLLMRLGLDKNPIIEAFCTRV